MFAVMVTDNGKTVLRSTLDSPRENEHQVSVRRSRKEIRRALARKRAQEDNA